MIILKNENWELKLFFALYDAIPLHFEILPGFERITSLVLASHTPLSVAVPLVQSIQFVRTIVQ